MKTTDILCALEDKLLSIKGEEDGYRNFVEEVETAIRLLYHTSEDSFRLDRRLQKVVASLLSLRQTACDNLFISTGQVGRLFDVNNAFLKYEEEHSCPDISQIEYDFPCKDLMHIMTQVSILPDEVLPRELMEECFEGVSFSTTISTLHGRRFWSMSDICHINEHSLNTNNERKKLGLIRQIYSESSIPVDKITLDEGQMYDKYRVFPSFGVPCYKVKWPAQRVLQLLGEGSRMFLEGGALVFETHSETRTCPTLESLTLTGSLGDTVHGVDLPIVLGAGAKGNAEIVDLNEARGLLVVGDTRQQADFLQRAMSSLLELRPEDVIFEIMPTVSAAGTYSRLCMAQKEMEKRAEALVRMGYADIWHQRRLTSDKRMPYVIIMMEGMDEYMEEDSRYGEKIVQKTLQILTQGKATGVHVIASLSKLPNINRPQGLIDFNFRYKLFLSADDDNDALLTIGATSSTRVTLIKD